MDNTEWRYERKFQIPDLSPAELIQYIKQHPYLFKEIFVPRYVNSIYFDTLGKDDYYQNVDGTSQRKKIRIRWYGKDIINIQKPVLEYKIKSGTLGTKERYALDPFLLTEQKNYASLFESSSLPKEIKHNLKLREASAYIHYYRYYFLSHDEKFRITIDTNILADTDKKNFIQKVTQRSSLEKHPIILELKYDQAYDHEAKQISNIFPFRLSKNSKYVNALDNVLFSS